MTSEYVYGEIASCHMARWPTRNNSPGYLRLHSLGHMSIQPLINRPLCPDNAIIAGFSGIFARCLYQRSRGLILGVLYAWLDKKSTAKTPRSSPTGTPSTPLLHPRRAILRGRIVRFARFHIMRSRENLFPAEAEEDHRPRCHVASRISEDKE